MTDDDSGSPNAAPVAQGPKETLHRIYKENDTGMNQPQPSNPPETPTPPPGGTLNNTRAPKSMALPEKHQNALRHIHTLESHNAKLYEDNCRLVNAVNTLNDRLTFFGAPQSTQVLRLADMQEKLRLSEANQALINQKYQELLQRTSAGSAQHHIGEELQAIREAYASLDREYRLFRLKAAADASRVVLQQSQGTVQGPIPAIHSELANTTQFHAIDRGRNKYASPTSIISPGSFQPFLDQKGNNRRWSSEGIMAQRSGPAPVATTWLAPLPTPPPSASLPGPQISPTGFPLHTPVSAGSFPLAHHSHHPRTFSQLHFVQQSVPEQHGAIIHPRQHCNEIRDTANNESAACGNAIPASALLKSSPRPPKRPNSELQTSTSPEGEHKKPRMEGEAIRPTTVNTDTCRANEILSPPASNDHDNDRNLSVSDSDVRSYQDCVNLIFEKDADIENGVFCGLCFDRYEAKMIPEPPDVLVQPDFDLLIGHCTTMHPAVWGDLRRKA